MGILLHFKNTKLLGHILQLRKKKKKLLVVLSVLLLINNVELTRNKMLCIAEKKIEKGDHLRFQARSSGDRKENRFPIMHIPRALHR